MGAEKYNKAVDELVRLIRSGAYSKKGVLPGEYELAGKLGVARETARKAIAELIKPTNAIL